MPINPHWSTFRINCLSSHPICSCSLGRRTLDHVAELESPCASRWRRRGRRGGHFWHCGRPDLVFPFLFLLGLLQRKYCESQGRRFCDTALVLLFRFAACSHGAAGAVRTDWRAPLANSCLG